MVIAAHHHTDRQYKADDNDSDVAGDGNCRLIVPGLRKKTHRL